MLTISLALFNSSYLVTVKAQILTVASPPPPSPTAHLLSSLPGRLLPGGCMLHPVPRRLALDSCVAQLLIHSGIYSKCDFSFTVLSTLRKVTIHPLNTIYSSCTLNFPSIFTATWQCQASWYSPVISALQAEIGGERLRGSPRPQSDPVSW